MVFLEATGGYERLSPWSILPGEGLRQEFTGRLTKINKIDAARTELAALKNARAS